MISVNNVHQIRTDMTEALKAVATKHGLVINLGRIRFNAKELRCKLEALAIDQTFGATEAEDKGTIIGITDGERAAWNAYCERYGLKPEHLGATIQLNGSPYKLVQIKPRFRKYPIIAVNKLTGKSYKWPAVKIRSALGINSATAFLAEI